MKTFGDRLREVRKECGFKTQSMLAKAVGGKTTHASVSDWENDKYLPSREAKDKLVVILNVNWQYLIKGVLPKYKDDIKVIDINKKIEYNYAYPLISWADLKKDVVMNGVSDPSNFFPSNYNSNDCFAVTIDNESMYPEFKPGEQILVDPSVEPLSGDYCVICIDNGDYLLRQYIAEGDTKLYKAVNPDWPKKVCEFTERDEIIGVIVEARRSYKKFN